MILADKILNLRKKNGWSQEELADKLNVSRQSVSKWEGALAIPDINKIIDMAKLFGVSTDYLLKDEIDETIYSNDEELVRKVTLKETNEFLDQNRIYGNRLAIGVFLCIISPIVLIFLAASVDTFGMNEKLAVGLGLICLFVLISMAILIFILESAKMNKYKYIMKDTFELEYGVSSIVKEKKVNFLNKYNVYLALAIVSIILGVLPLIICAILELSNFIIVSMVCLLLLIVGIAVYFIVLLCMKKSGYDQILKEDDYAVGKKKTNNKLSGFFWPIATAIYLGWSFLSNDWQITWVVWPIAGLVYAAIEALLGINDKVE